MSFVPLGTTGISGRADHERISLSVRPELVEEHSPSHERVNLLQSARAALITSCRNIHAGV